MSSSLNGKALFITEQITYHIVCQEGGWGAKKPFVRVCSTVHAGLNAYFFIYQRYLFHISFAKEEFSFRVAEVQR